MLSRSRNIDRILEQLDDSDFGKPTTRLLFRTAWSTVHNVYTPNVNLHGLFDTEDPEDRDDEDGVRQYVTSNGIDHLIGYGMLPINISSTAGLFDVLLYLVREVRRQPVPRINFVKCDVNIYWRIMKVRFVFFNDLVLL